MTYAKKIAAKPKGNGRPASYETLLLEPITSNLESDAQSYEDWEFDHGASQRFYVGGMRWFMRASGISEPAKLAVYGQRAAQVCKDETNWSEMPKSVDLWSSCSLNQFRYGKNRRPLFFQKAALVILSCELALTELLDTGRISAEKMTVADLYSHMTVIPAVWNINDFDKTFVKSLEEKGNDTLSRLTIAAQQDAKTFVDHLAAGYTVTSSTVIETKKFIDANFPELKCGSVRAKPGTHLGRLNATDYEAVDAG